MIGVPPLDAPAVQVMPTLAALVIVGLLTSDAGASGVVRITAVPVADCDAEEP